jgi:hypothetical protein
MNKLQDVEAYERRGMKTDRAARVLRSIPY